MTTATPAIPEIVSDPSKMLNAIKPADLSEALKDANVLVEQAGRVPTDTATWSRDTFAAAGDLRKMLRSRMKAAEELRKSWTGPINAGVKLINGFFAERVQPIEKADAAVERLMLKWSREEEARVAAEQARIRREAEEKALREAAEREKEAAAARALEEEAAKAGDVATATAAAEVAREAEQKRDEVIDQAAALPVGDTAVRKVRGAYGSTSGVKKTWKARLTDLRALVGNDEALALIMAHDGARTEIRKALKPLLEPRLTALSDTGKCEPLAGVEFEQESSINIK